MLQGEAVRRLKRRAPGTGRGLGVLWGEVLSCGDTAVRRQGD